MWSVIVEWLSVNYTFLFVVVVIAVAAWLVARFYYSRFKKTEEKVKTLPCAKHDELFNKISEDLTVIRTYITVKNPKNANLFSRKASPRKLNEEGERLLLDFGGDKFIEDNKDCLIKFIEDKKPKTALDVETTAAEVLYENLDSDMFNGLKKWVYNSPTRKLTVDGIEQDYAITMGDVCFVLSIPLRDLYLSVHPEIEV